MSPREQRSQNRLKSAITNNPASKIRIAIRNAEKDFKQINKSLIADQKLGNKKELHFSY